MLKKVMPFFLLMSAASFALEKPAVRRSVEARYVHSVMYALIAPSCNKFPQNPLCDSFYSHEILIPTEKQTLVPHGIVPECGHMKLAYGVRNLVSVDDRLLSYDDFQSQIQSSLFTWGNTSFDWGHVGPNFNFCVSQEGEAYLDIHHYNKVQKASPALIKANIALTTFSHDVAKSLVQRFDFKYEAASLAARHIETWLTKVKSANKITSPQELDGIYTEVVGAKYMDLRRAIKAAGMGDSAALDQLTMKVSQKYGTTPEKALDYLVFVVKGAALL